MEQQASQISLLMTPPSAADDVHMGQRMEVAEPQEPAGSPCSSSDEARYISEWLRNIKDQYAELYTQAFVDNGYDSAETIAVLESQDLIDIGVKKGHAKLIIASANPHAGAVADTPPAPSPSKQEVPEPDPTDSTEFSQPILPPAGSNQAEFNAVVSSVTEPDAM